MSAASAIHMNVFGLNPVVVFGTDEQRARMLPGIVEGREKACFGVTEPTRPQHHAIENPGRAQGRQVCRQWPEGVDLHCAGRA